MSIRLLTLIPMSLLALTQSAQSATKEAPHLELELESRDYQRLLETRAGQLRPQVELPGISADLSELLNLGKRNLDLLDHLNSKRPESEKLGLTSPALQPGYPIDAPKESSPKILRDKKAAVQKEIPPELGNILFEGQAFPDQLALSDEDYLMWARKVDGIYQGASRWKLQEPYLESYKARRTKDIRGYYYLTHETNWRETVSRWTSLSAAEKTRLRPWIANICLNSTLDSSGCASQISAAESSAGGMISLVDRHMPRAEALWNSYFKLGGRRSDVKWRRDNPMLATLPFKDPHDGVVQKWLLDNIEDEWRLNGWSLKLDFQSSASSWSTAEVVFVPGATPHVNGLGGNTITMDANQPLEEYGTRWTIRHEFGHVLGLPDCYVEFFDEDRDAMISYQLDLDNLMCSRRGKLQSIHYDELKRAYLK